MNGPQAAWLPDGRRLHLNHGPIDLIVEAFGGRLARQTAYDAAVGRFQTVLAELVSELPELRSAAETSPRHFTGTTAQRMEVAVRPYAADGFITPMAAVAGAVADEILAAMLTGPELERTYVNNGGDIALCLAPGQSMSMAVAGTGHGFADRITVRHGQGIGGIATSGWRGRSFSLGIADAVTVLARTGAEADAAATIIANAVDLPGHAAVTRVAAVELAPDSDLGTRPVTTGVGSLSAGEVARALDAGRAVAEDLHRRGLIAAAALFLNGRARTVGGVDASSMSGKEAAREDGPAAAILPTHLCPAGHLSRKGGDSLSSTSRAASQYEMNSEELHA